MSDVSVTTKPRRVGGKASWFGAEMAKSEDWIYRLSDPQRREILEALKYYLARGVADLDATRQDFPLPTVAPLLQRLVRECDGGCGLLLVRRMPLENLSEEHIHRLYWGLSLHLGVVMPQSGKAELIGDIRARPSTYENRDARGYTSGRAQNPHVDTADIVMLMVRQRAKEGGVSRLCSSVTVHDTIVDTRPDLAAALYDPVPLTWVTPDPVSGETWYTLPVFGFNGAHFASRFSYNRSMKANKLPDTPKLTPLHLEAFDCALATANNPDLRLDMHFEPGDLQFVVNHQILHGRTAIIDHEEEHLKRHVMRMWIASPTGRPLPETWKHAYGSIEPNSVRGGVPWWWFTERFGAYRNRQAVDLGMTPSPRDAGAVAPH